MALPVNRPLHEWNLDCHMKDTTTSGVDRCVAYTAAPFRGRVVRVYAALYANLSGTASVITTKIGSTTLSGCTISLTTSGVSTPTGYVFSATPTDSSVTYFNEGDVISFTSDGAAGDATNAATCTAILRRV